MLLGGGGGEIPKGGRAGRARSLGIWPRGAKSRGAKSPGTPVLQKLHWLPVDHRIIFKVLLITFKIVCGCAPSYLKDLLEPYMYVVRRSLRSATQCLLVTPKSSTRTYGDRAFSVAAPKLWNNLPTSLKDSDFYTFI